LREVVPAAEHGSEAGCCAKTPAAAKVVKERAVSATRRTRAVQRLLVVPPVENETYLSFITVNSFRSGMPCNLDCRSGRDWKQWLMANGRKRAAPDSWAWGEQVPIWR